ncbi:hypothetical protein D6C97_09290 [Aureobasidium pullulans]|nr:hypothetical protein D6C97_09290 [Aureobasidium pullulans]
MSGSASTDEKSSSIPQPKDDHVPADTMSPGPVDLCFETAARKQVVSRGDLSREQNDRPMRNRFRQLQHNRYQPEWLWDRVKEPVCQILPKTTFLELLATYWDPPHHWDLPSITTLSRVLHINELADKILGNLRRKDLMSCLQATRMLRRAVQTSPTAQAHLSILPFEPAGELHRADTCCLPFPENRGCPMLITKEIGRRSNTGQLAHHIFIDIYFGHDGHGPNDFDIAGSWADMKLPDMPETIKWKAWVDCECRYILENFHGDRGPRTGTATTLWGHRLITHDKPLREIAECAKEVFKAHEKCKSGRIFCVSFKCSARTKLGDDGEIECGGREEPEGILSGRVIGKLLNSYLKPRLGS